MKNWGSALFPLSLLLTLAALTFWLRYASELPDARRDGKYRHDPDYIVNDATLRKLDNTGQLVYTLKAPEIRHYPDDDSSEVSQPHLVHLNPKKPTLTMNADTAHISSKGEQVDLHGNVRVHRAATAKDAEMILTTPQLTVLPDEEKAYTKHPVLITQGNSWIKGIGLRMDNRAQTYLLEAQARASLESRQQSKQKNKQPCKQQARNNQS